ncbi:hypothetical protein [Photobacterium carnosum]|uniref:hypothetical protein n=1 Tax=Photobacterium carnosum TaxID=2023717 RepID=UPI001E373181|nr:hypothetical protein [Photobacterium carnosum]MCD9530894.1 hypothetical protein [Photobacterium carnosum]
MINFLLGSLAAYHAKGRADVRNGKSRPLHIFRKKPESNDSGFFSSLGNSNDSEVVQLVNFLLGSLAAYHAEGRADVRNGKSRPLHIFRKKPESNDSGFFSSVENSNDSVVVQLVNFLLGSLAAYYAEGRADVRNGKSCPLHIFRKKPESNDSVFFSSVGNDGSYK